VRRIEVGVIRHEVDAGILGSPTDAAVIGPHEETLPERKSVINGIGVTAVDADKATVTSVDLGPAGKAGEFLGTVVLAAAISNTGIDGIQGYTRELGDLQVAVDIRPLEVVGVGILQAVDATVIAIQ